MKSKAFPSVPHLGESQTPSVADLGTSGLLQRLPCFERHVPNEWGARGAEGACPSPSAGGVSNVS